MVHDLVLGAIMARPESNAVTDVQELNGVVERSTRERPMDGGQWPED
jgi:hypothetical protein